MSYPLSQFLTNVDGNLLGHGEIDYNDLPDHLIPLGKFKVPYKLLVLFTHQALLRDYGRGEAISDAEVRGSWADASDELISAGSINEYIRLMRAM